EVYISRLASENNISREVLIQQVNGIMRKNAGTERKNEKYEIESFGRQRRENPEAVAHLREYRAECGIISYLASNPDELEYISSRINSDYFVTEFNRKVYEKMTERLKSAAEFDIMSLQSEFSADEMGKITEIIVGNREVDIDRGALDDYIKILEEHKNNNTNIKEMSDDDFLSYFENLKKNK
ncbi:MAG: DnaB-like helicase N-terminal domain-containing protein, partial [Oscillospiraceae bacterium]